MKSFLKFLRFLVLPLVLGLALDVVLWFRMNAEVLLVEFVIHFVGFFTLFVIRWLRHARDCVFSATFSVFVGAAVELLGIYVIWCVNETLGVETWVLLLHMGMLFISVIALFAYSIAIKAVETIKKWDEEHENEIRK